MGKFPRKECKIATDKGVHKVLNRVSVQPEKISFELYLMEAGGARNILYDSKGSGAAKSIGILAELEMIGDSPHPLVFKDEGKASTPTVCIRTSSKDIHISGNGSKIRMGGLMGWRSAVRTYALDQALPSLAHASSSTPSAARRRWHIGRSAFSPCQPPELWPPADAQHKKKAPCC